MNKKKLIFAVLFFFIAVFNSKYLLGQGSLTTGTQSEYVDVQSYAGGLIRPNAFGFRIHINGPLNIANWSLKVRVIQNINYQGKVFDLSKIRIKINKITGDGYTLQSIGTSNPEIPLSLADVFIIQNSKMPINESGYKQIYFSFDIYVVGGAYLQDFKSWDNHPFNLVFSLEATSGPISSSQTSGSFLRINPSGTPPVDPVYSIQVNNSNASNGLLEFKSIDDYVNGVSQTYTNGLSLISSTTYALQVKAQTSAFESATNSIPIGIVSLNLKDPNSSLEGTVVLSNTVQTVINNASNNGTQARNFNIRYFTTPNDQRLQNAKPDTYRATLLYTLIPQ
jgi:hypothetical protein